MINRAELEEVEELEELVQDTVTLLPAKPEKKNKKSKKSKKKKEVSFPDFTDKKSQIIDQKDLLKRLMEEQEDPVKEQEDPVKEQKEQKEQEELVKEQEDPVKESDKEHLDQEQKRIQRDKLKQKLKNKIGNKRYLRCGITRSQAKTLSEKVELLLETLKTDKIDINTTITEEICDKILTILSINEMRTILAQVDQNSTVSDNFKEFLTKLIDTVNN